MKFIESCRVVIFNFDETPSRPTEEYPPPDNLLIYSYLIKRK